MQHTPPMKTLHLPAGPSAATSAHFEIHSMQWIEENRMHDISAPHKHEYYVVMWIKRGEGIHHVDFQPYPLTDNSLWFISPGQPHHLQTKHTPEGYVLSFADDFFCISEANRDILVNTGLFFNFSDCSPFHVLPQQVSMLDFWVQEMIEEFSQAHPMRSEALLGYLKIFLIKLSRLYTYPLHPGTEGLRSEGIARKFMELVERYVGIKTKVQQYAGSLGLTSNYLNTIIKKVTGISASEHIKNRLLLEIKRQMYAGEKSAKEIAYALNFEDEAYFSRFFKNNTGYTFSAYQEMLKKGKYQDPVL